VTFNSKQRARHEPLFDVNPRTGVSFEVFYADRAFGNVRQRRHWLVLVVARAWLPASRPRDRPVPYELFSISPRLGDQFGGYAQHPLRYSS